jgi:two-component system, NtrC family, nitrogen regulation sensor histidine kinase NtrY
MHTPKQIKLKIFLCLSLTVLFFVWSIFYSKKISPVYLSEKVDKVNSILSEKETLVDNILIETANKIKTVTTDSLFFEKCYSNLYQQESIILLVFQDSVLKYWSDNSVNAINTITLKNNIVLLSNAWFEIRKKESDDYIIIGLIKIKNAYIYENQYLQNNFQKDFYLPANTIISREKSEYIIFNKEGNFLFSLIFPDQFLISYHQGLMIVSFYLLTFIFLIFTLIFSYLFLGLYFRNRTILFLGLVFDILILRWITIFFKIPKILYSLPLFKPSIFASSDIFPSLGDLLVNSITILAISFVIFKNLKVTSWLNKQNRKKRYLITSAFLIVVFVMFFVLSSSLGSIITNSNISFDLFNITSISSYSIIGLLCFGLLILSFIFLTYEFSVAIVRLFIDWEQFFPHLILLSGIYFLICKELQSCDSFVVVFIMIYLSFFWIYLRIEDINLRLSSVLFFLILFSILSTYIIYQTNYKSEKETRHILTQNLADQRDYTAEFLFNEITLQAPKDTVLLNLLTKFSLNNDSAYLEIQNHFKNKYFSRYWDKYDLLITLCDSSKVLDIQPDNYTINCFEYFDNLIRDYGRKTSFNNLTYMDINISADNYIGIIDIPNLQTSTRIYVEVFSKLIPKGLGYPELLMDYKSQNNSNLTSYSWARYEKDEIVYYFGKYLYSMKLSNYSNIEKENGFFNLNKYNHYLFEVDKDSALILSKKNPDLIDIAAPFSYFFIFYGLFIGVIFLFYKWPFHFKKYTLTFKKRLQWSVISLILFSFFVIGISSLFYIVNLNNNKNIDLLSEKSHSVLIELEHKLAMEESLSPDIEQFLSNLLYKLSLVFFSDINLYDLNGSLLATSRPEIFNKGLISSQMNPGAFNQMNNLKNSLFIQNETIGDYKYLSAYLPFRNERNKPIAYLNLPYFAKQDDLTNEISTYLVAFINIYVILTSIAILITLIFSNYISKPLQLIKEKIGRLKLGKQNEKIEWLQNDEIGSLVIEYNRMVDELAKSAELLARSERESAWREMAKQIAHEIKNPLTPMKLSVQYLQKAWDEKAADWDQRLKRFTETLVEQIESLSSIASEFSDFAKMPKSNFEITELNKIIENAIRLFRDTHQVKIEFTSIEPHFVMADNEQLHRVFINLINNSIQAIANPEKGLIKISIEKDANFHLIRFTDNGKGIPTEQKKKVFYPNFTTKSGGMGLGLAMVKNIIQNSNGEITFESEEGKGTTFIIALPVYEE